MLLVIAGPSGVGKGTIVKKLRERDPSLWLSVSANTRPPRPGEQEGVDYHFVDRDDFLALRDRGGFLEWFEVYGDLKGTPRKAVEEHLAAGDDVLLEIDVQGALSVKEQFPDAVLVFVAPPSLQELERRLLSRPSADSEDIEARLAAATSELEQSIGFDAVVVNDDVDAAVSQVAAILNARRGGSA
ncbi:MAG: guanylate kinase [Acidimicrobiia bacterium]